MDAAGGGKQTGQEQEQEQAHQQEQEQLSAVDADPWEMFHLWSEANLANGKPSSRVAGKGAASPPGRAGEHGVRKPGVRELPEARHSNPDSVSVSEADSQSLNSNFVVPVKHGSMPSQPRRKAVSEFVTHVHASLAQVR